MGNLESEWDFGSATLALALTPGHFALRVCAVDLKNAPQTAEPLDKIKQCLEAPQIAVEVLTWPIEMKLDIQIRAKLLQRTLGGGGNRGLLQ